LRPLDRRRGEIKALEDAGLLTWVNRLKRVRERCQDLFGRSGSLGRVLRTSNGYRFNDPKGAAQRGFSSKSDFPSGTPIQDPSLSKPAPADDLTGMDSPLLTALHRLGSAIAAKNGLAVS
jgi:hypothetical protein